MKTFDQIQEDYNYQSDCASADYEIERKAAKRQGRKENFDKCRKINYSQINQDLRKAIIEMGFSDAQAGYILAYVEQEFHASYLDVIYKAREFADLFKNFPK